MKKITYFLATILLLFAQLLFLPMSPRVHASSFVSITSPKNGSSITAGQTTIKGSADPTKNIKVLANGTIIGATRVENDGSWSLNANIPEGTTQLTAQLYDDPMGFVNNFLGPNSMTKFNATSRVVESTLSAGLQAITAIAMHPSQPYLYALVHANGGVVVVNTTTKAIVTYIAVPTGAGLTGMNRMAISPDGSRLYVDYDDDQLVAINTVTNQVIGSPVTFGGNIDKIKVNSDGSKLYIAGDEGLEVMTTSNNSITTVPLNASAAGRDVALDDTANKAYVIDTNGEVNVVNTLNNTLTSHDSSGGSDPQAIAITANHAKLYISDGAADEIHVIATSDLTTLAATIGSVDNPTDLVFGSGNTAYVGSNGNNNIYVIDTSADTLTTTVDTTGNNSINNPTHPVMSPDNSKVYSGQESSSDIKVIQTSDNTVIDTITHSYNGYSIAFNKNNTKAYITGLANAQSILDYPGTLSEVDLVNNSIDWSIGVGNNPIGIALSADDSTAYVANALSGTVSVVNLGTQTISATISGFGTFPFATAIDYTHNKLYVSTLLGNNVAIVDLSNNTIADTISLGDNGKGIILSPDNSKLYVATGSGNPGHLEIYSTADKSQIANTAVGANPFDVQLTSDGSKVFTANSSSQDVSVISTATNTVTSTISTGKLAFGLGISPDDSQLFVTSQNSSNIDAYDLSSNNLIGSVTVQGIPSAFGNFIASTLLASTSLTINAGALANTGTNTLAWWWSILLLLSTGAWISVQRPGRKITHYKL